MTDRNVYEELGTLRFQARYAAVRLEIYKKLLDTGRTVRPGSAEMTHASIDNRTLMLGLSMNDEPPDVQPIVELILTTFYEEATDEY